MNRLKKRMLSLLLVFCMTFSLLPGTAYAAVGDLLGNSPRENQALLEELENLTGQDGEAIQALLEQYGLLDEDGNLVTDKTVELDGVAYTLDEIEALLNDPDTDLGQVGYVDGVPIALGDLRTIIAIERELQRIQETYFSGKVFEGESLTNLNDLMEQLQNDGISVNAGAAGSTAVADVSSFDAVAAGDSTSFQAQAGVTYSVDVRFDAGLAGIGSVTVSLGDDSQTLNSDMASATLTYDAASAGPVSLTVQPASGTSVPDYAYGELAGAVQFSNAKGFVFQNGNDYSDSHTVRVTNDVEVPDLSTKWVQGYWEGTTQWAKDISFEFLTNVDTSSNENLGISSHARTDVNRVTVNEFIRFLQGAKGYTDAEQVEKNDDAVQFKLTVDSLDAVCIYDIRLYAWNAEENYYGLGPNMFFLPAQTDTGVDRIDLQTEDYGLTFTNYNGTHPSNFADIGSNAAGTPLVFEASTKLGTNAVPETLEVRDGIFESSAVTGESHYGGYANLCGTLSNTAVELVNDGKAPVLNSITAPSATYRPGQLVPVVLSFNELVYVSDDASISINGKTFTADDLHMSKAGNQILLWYPVQKVDGAQVIITSCSGITDIFGNAADINVTDEDAKLESALLRDAATGVSARYDKASSQVVVTITLDSNTKYENKYTNYHKPAGDEPREVPYQAVVTDSTGAVVATEQVYVDEDGETFSTDPFEAKATTTEQTYTVTLQVNEGTRESQNWVDLSYNQNLKDTFSVAALIPADTVAVKPEADKADYTLSLAEEYRPTLTAGVYGPPSGTPPTISKATHQSGKWSSSDEEIATITTEADYSGKVTLTGKKVGQVTFTFTADNGTPKDGSDDKPGISEIYTVVAGDSLALVIPEGASRIVARQNAPATVLWSSNAEFFASDVEFQYTIEVFDDNYTTEAELAGKKPVATYTAAKDKNSVTIPENVLHNLSTGDTPAYTVRVSMPHPYGSSEDVRLSALAWIVVNPEPAKAMLTRPESIYLTDAMDSVGIQWSLGNWTEGSGQTATLTILQVTEDDTSKPVCKETLSGGSDTYTLSLSDVADGFLKDTYQIMLSVENPGEESPSTDSFPLYVYNADALQITDSEGQPITSLPLDNTDKVSDLTWDAEPSSTASILSMRQELGLLDYIGINYNDYSWNSFKDGIAWATDNDDISVNYKQGGLYEDIKLFDFDTYLPELKMGVATVKDGTATITATHAATGTTAEITVTANTLKDKFYLFQVTPALETTLRYVDGKGVEKSATTNVEGVLALYEPDGIASDVWLSSKNGDTEYMGTIYHQNLQSGERDARKLQLYPLNTFRLREAAKAELTLVKPDGSPLADAQVTVRGGVFKNDSFCETAGLGTRRYDIGAAGEDQTDTIFTTDETGKLTVYFDATQFWSQAAGETEKDVVSPVDKIQYVLEIRDIGGNAYYPIFQVVNGTVSVQQEMRTASGVVVLETVPQGEANKPFVARQVVDYHLQDGALIDTRHSTGFVGPNYNFKEAVLTTTMLLWGQSAGDYTVTITDESGYVPASQSSTNTRYPFASMPVVENTLTLNEETMTTSGWLPDGKDVGLKTRLTVNGTLVQERTMPFRAIDLTRVTPVNEDENVTGMLVTMKDASGWTDSSVNFGSGGSSILNALVGDLGELAGPVDTSVFQMLITPSEDPTVFNALIWAGYDSLDLKDVEYKDGVAVSANFLTKGLETDMPSVGDLQSIANGTYDPMGSYDPYRSNRLSDVAGFDFGFQLEGYYEAEIRYNRDTQKWEVYTKGGGFTAGVGIEFGFDVNAMAGPVPVTGSFELGGAMQLSLQAATRYSQQDGLTWSNPTASSVTDFLTNLRLRAYVEAFGGIGFDYSLIALKIGLFGKLDVNSENSFLSREYLADESKQQLNGQYLDIQSEVGIKFKAVFALISYEKVLASGSFGYGKSFNDWKEISDYWENTDTGLDDLTLLMAAQSGLQEVSSTATLQSRDYLEQYARSWGEPFRLFSLDAPSTVANLQENANPASFPEVSDDGQILAYISDSDSGSIYDSRAHFSKLSGDSYGESKEFPSPSDGTGSFVGFGDSDVDISGTEDFAVAAWVRMNTRIDEKDAGDDVSAAEQNLLMNGTEIVASVFTGSGWSTKRLTNNATPDLAPAVATNGQKAIVFWRSVYSADPENGLMDFSAQDQIMYSVFDTGVWSEPKMLYNGANGSVKGLQAAMMSDGTAIAVYTLDRTGASDGSGQEIGYTIVNSDGSLGHSMLVTSDENLDENPQVIAASLHSSDGSVVASHRFILGWHSQRSGSSDIQLLAVDASGAMSNNFPASLSALTSSGQANVSGDFRFARVWNSRTLGTGYVENLTILWSETVSDETTNGLMTAAHSQLKAARLLAEDTDDDKNVDSFRLTAPQVVAELLDNTLLDHFDAYVKDSFVDNSVHSVKAVIQATYYDQEHQEYIYDKETDTTVTLPGEKTMLYTASQNFEPYGLEVEAIGVDYANLMANSLTPIQFTVRNTGVNKVTGLTITLKDGKTATMSESLAPNENATLTVYHKVGETVANVEYTITDTDSNITKTGTVYLDYPDIGISQMKVLEEKEGQRTIAVTLYNASDAPLADSGRTVNLAFYTDNLLTEKANVTCSTAGVSGSGGSTLTISDADALKLIDAGSFTLVLTYDVGAYVEAQGLREIPDSGVYLYADAWAEGTIGTQSGAKRLPECYSSDNQSAVLLTGAYARTGEKTTLNVTQTNSNGATTAVVELKNNSLQDQTTATLVASLLDENDQVLETKTTGIEGALNGENAQTSIIQFSQLGSRVVVHAAAAGEDKLFFEGLPVSIDDFTADESGALTCSISGISADSTLVTAISGNKEKVTINGQEFTSGSGSLSVPIGTGETVITVNIGSTAYTLHITSTHTSGGGGGGSGTTASYRVTVESAENGVAKSSRTSAGAGTTVKLTVTPDDGYRLSSLTVTNKNGKALTLNDKNDGTYTFTMPASDVTVKAAFIEVDAEEFPFVDVPLDSWYYDGVSYVYENGLMTGTSATTFAPDMTTTRSMVATILWRLEGSPVVDYAMTFTDVDSSTWYTEAVRWAASEGIITGYGNGNFGPNDSITREQMATMLYRYAQYKGYDVSVGENTNILSYTDFAELGEYAVAAMQWAVGAGIINGTSASTLSPRGNATRAEVAVILMRYCKSVDK